MTDTPQFLDIIFFAMVAVFLGLRLRSVLGRRNPDQEPPPPAIAKGDVVVPLEQRLAPVTDASSDPLSGGLKAIQAAESSFHPDQFLQGAGLAFEMIVKAFASADLTVLRPLLSDKVFADFSQAIEQRAAHPEDQPMTLLRVVSVTLAEASLIKGVAEIAVRFVSEQQGADGQEVRLIDLWRFARTIGSSDPNWRLVATGSLES
jgi:predicted lipid-binding transport protein (Tim44 family)